MTMTIAHKILGLLLLTALPLTGNTGADHEFHLSKCLIEYNSSEQALQISMHLFIDDLEDALRLKGQDNLQIGTPKEDPQAETYLRAYLAEHFVLTVNGQKVEHTFLGKEPGEDPLSLWCYIEVPAISNLRSLQVKTSILTETFADQKNLISVVGPGQRKGYFILEKDNPNSEALQFN